MNDTPYRATTWLDLGIVAVSLAAVILILLIVTGTYRDAADAGALLGIIFPSIVAVATSAFGVTQLRKADEAQKQTDAAQRKAKSVTAKATEALTLLQGVEPNEAYGSFRVGSESGATARAAGGDQTTEQLDSIVSQRANFQQAKALLAEAARVDQT